MNFLDILIAIPLCFFIYKGWRRGLIFEITSLAGIIVGVWACVHFSTWVAETLNIQGDTGVLIAFFITFAAVVALAYFLGKAIEGIFKMVKLNFLNKLFGVKRLYSSLTQVYNAQKPQRWRSQIDEMFE